MSNFRLTHEDKWSRGFHMKFDNGWTISVQWGMSNYCEARGDTSKDNSMTAEIAFFDPDHKMHYMPEWCDQVKGHCTTEEVMGWMNHCASYPKDKRYTKSPYISDLDSEDE